MNKQIRRYSLLTALFVMTLAQGVLAAETAWTEDYEQAKKQAQEQKKDLLLYFTGSDWCGYCKKLDAAVLSKELFLEQAAKDYILVKIDFPIGIEQSAELKEQNEALKKTYEKKYKLVGYPTIYLTDAAGLPYASAGYKDVSPEIYLKLLAFLKEAKPFVDPGAQWLENYEIAKIKAEALGKDLLINFSGSDWCGWCIKLDKEVFAKDYFKQEAPKDFVLLNLDFPNRKKQSPEIEQQNATLKAEYEKRYGFQGFPTVYLVDSQGLPYGKTGYQPNGPEAFVKQVRATKAEKNKGS